MVMSFRAAMRLDAGVFAALAICLMAAPGVVYGLFDLHGSPAADVLARRACLLVAGLAYLAFKCARHPQSPSRRSVVICVCLILVSLAALGTVEWARGSVGSGIWVAVVFECVLAGLLWRAERLDTGKVCSEGTPE